MRILITGGAGFIGSAFARKISSSGGHKIAVIDSLTYAGDKRRLERLIDSVSFFEADIRDPVKTDQIFAQFKPDIVYNFAAHTHVDRSILESDDFVTTNIFGTHNLLKLSLKYKTSKFVQISTDEVYGELGESGSFTEKTPIDPNSPYSASKASADHLVNSFTRTFGLNTIITRCSNNYGAWQYPEKFIPVIIYKALNNEPVPVYAKGENIREWIFVDDFADALSRYLTDTKERIYNIGSGYEMRNIDLVKTILRLLGKSESLIQFVKDRPGHDFRYSIDCSRFRNEFGWKAATPLEQGLKSTVDWYTNHMDWVKAKLGELSSLWNKVYK